MSNRKTRYIDPISPRDYHAAMRILRGFFVEKKGFVETPVQHRLSILAACEDPRTIGQFAYAGELWPLPQTGQMHLEWELLTEPSVPGYFCVSTSYRNEPKPKDGRHNLIFPMFEFETHGGIEELKRLEKELLEFSGFGPAQSFPEVAYRDAALMYGISELTDVEEAKLCETHGQAVLLTDFPETTSPFWNMKREGEYARKIDVILCGMETIGSAERSSDKKEMQSEFHTISQGRYARKLYDAFGKDRVEKELQGFLSLEFFPRFGGGIGLTRLMRALELKSSEHLPVVEGILTKNIIHATA